MATATLGEYAKILRDELREHANTRLSEFEVLMEDIGYGWLNGYMENARSGPSKWVILAI
jgi:hypothetical protein